MPACSGAGLMIAEATLRLAQLLSASEYRSGQHIATELACSRAAVWKQVEALRKLGVAVRAEAGRGYCLERPLELLDTRRIRAGLGSKASGLLNDLELITELDSSNSEILRRPLSGRHGLAVLAERQSGGRGRRGRSWHSPFARNLYLSLGWQFDGGPAGLACLPLAVAVAVGRAVQGLGVAGVRLKWPNDIWLGEAKLGGCLVEMQGDVSGPCSVVVGVGLNVHMGADSGASVIDQPWAALIDVLPAISRNQAACAVLDSLLCHLADYAGHGFEPLREYWRALDGLAGRRVVLQRETGRVAGVAIGISPEGGLIVQTGSGRETFLVGDASLHPVGADDSTKPL